MSTTAVTKKPETPEEAQKRQLRIEEFRNRTIAYVPFGETDEISLTVNMIRNYLAVPTKDGHKPTDGDCLKFAMLCMARRLNPWVSDAYMVGYDSKDGPTFTLITAHQALLKRAELHEAYQGLQSGVIVRRGSEIIELEGTFTIDGDVLLGGWAQVYRRDRITQYIGKVKLATFDNNLSRWRIDKPGMICKVAEATALRKAFPTQLTGMYTTEEMDRVVDRKIEHVRPQLSGASAVRAKLGIASHVADAPQKPEHTQPATQPELSEPIYDDAPEPEPLSSGPPSDEDLIASGEYERTEADPPKVPAKQASMLDGDDSDSYYGKGG